MKSLITAVALSLVASVSAIAASTGPSCRDPWVTAALQQLGKGTAADTGNSGLCNIDRYHAGHWNSQADLNAYVKQSFECSDPWIGQVYAELRSVKLGWGKPDAAECNPALYGGGHWSSYDDLKQKVAAYLAKKNAPVPPPPPPSAGSAGLSTIHVSGPQIRRVHEFAPNEKGYFFITSNGDAFHFSRSTSNIVAQGGGNYRITLPDGSSFIASGIVAQGAGNIVAQGAGNIVAAGAGNIVAQGAGNYAPAPSALITENGAGIMRIVAQIVAQGAGNLTTQQSAIVTTNGTNLWPQFGAGMQGSLMSAEGTSVRRFHSYDNAKHSCGEEPVFEIATHNAYARLHDVPQSMLASKANGLLVGYVCLADVRNSWRQYSGPWTAPVPPAAQPAAASANGLLDAEAVLRVHGELSTPVDRLRANGMIPFTTNYRGSDLPLMFFSNVRNVAAYRYGDKSRACGPYVMLLDGKRFAQQVPQSAVSQVISFACRNDALAAGWTQQNF